MSAAAGEQSEHAEGVNVNLGGTGQPGVIVAALDFNWPCNGLIDKCCEQDREGARGCAAPLAAVQT